MTKESAVKHTPGPWQINGTWPDDVVDATGSLVVSAYGDFESPVTKANAHLIAAAPALLEALELLVASDNGVITAAELKSNFAKAKAAISLAKGEPK